MAACIALASASRASRTAAEYLPALRWTWLRRYSAGEYLVRVSVRLVLGLVLVLGLGLVFVFVLGLVLGLGFGSGFG